MTCSTMSSLSIGEALLLLVAVARLRARERE
jgi:hypothetical protein